MVNECRKNNEADFARRMSRGDGECKKIGKMRE